MIENQKLLKMHNKYKNNKLISVIHILAPLIKLWIHSTWQWWLSEMAWLITPIMNRFGKQAQSVTLIADISGLLQLANEQANSDNLTTSNQSKGSSDWKTACSGRAVTVLLHPCHVMCLQMTLPRSAQHNLKEVIKYKLLAEAPIDPEKLYFDVHPVNTSYPSINGNNTELVAEIVICTRTTVNKLEEVIEHAGATECVIGFSKNGQKLPRYIFTTSHHTQRGGKATQWHHRLKISMLLIIFSLIPSLYVSASWLTTHTQIAIDVQKEAQGNLIILAEQQAQINAIQNTLATEISAPRFTFVLNELASHLPKSAWLNQLHYEHATLKISGFAVEPPIAARSLEHSDILAHIKLESVSRVDLENNPTVSQFTLHTTLSNKNIQ